ncbi:MAG TPA: tetratricopeptide repeat protein [Candidatus Limnocylindrales bacterium]|nr:tetratricopeptide repeat protein [Candidatus Limnocylindrales bacterium]
MGEPLPGARASQKPAEVRLDSWKEIAAYLDRDVTTVQRWEKREAMPVHRHVHDKRGSVYALPSELDAWVESRRQHLEEGQKAARPEAPMVTVGDHARRWSNTRRLLAAGVVAALVLAASGYLLFRNHSPRVEQSKIKSLAVLPLKNLSGDSNQDYLADGMTEALIGRLAGIRDLRVVSHTSVARFKNTQLSAPEIAKALGVDALVEGSVTREGDRIRVTAQLIRGATDEHFWSETYDRELEDVLSLQSELAQAIAERVEVTVTGSERERLAAVRPVAPEVYESYLRGQYAFQGNDRGSIEEGIRDFNDAIQKDPTFAPAYVALGKAYSELGTIFVGGVPSETRPKVISAAQKALELDPSIAEAHILLGTTLQQEWQWAKAEAEYRKALELSPNDARAHAAFAYWLLCQGRTSEAVDWIERAREIDPVAMSGADVGWMLFLAHRYDEAIHEIRGTLAVNPNDASALWALGFALIENNQPGEAIPVLEKAASLTNRSAGVLAVLIRAYAHAGKHNEALRVLAELKARKKSGYVPAGAFINAYLGLGDTEDAFISLEQGYSERSNILQFLKVHPCFDPIRGDPRFADLMKRVGLQ